MPIAFPKRFRPIANVPLRWVLVIPFVVQTVGAVALVGYLSYRNGQQAVSNLSHRIMDEVSDRTTLYLKQTLELPHLINTLNADAIRLGQIPDFESEDSTTLEKYFWTQLLRFPAVSTIAIANERGGMVGSGRSDQSSMVSVYRTPRFAKGTYSVSMLNEQGNETQFAIVAEKYDARTRPWYQTPARTGHAVWSPIYQFISREASLAISAGLPIYHSSGRLQGVLATDITLDRLNQFLAGLQISQSGQIFIVERSGLLVASSRQAVLQSQGEAQQRIQAQESQDPVMRAAMAQLTHRFESLSKIESTQWFDIHAQDDREAQFISVIPFRDRYGLDWLIVLVVPKSDFTAEIQANTAQTLLLCGLTLGITIALGTLTASWITKPIFKLQQASQSLAEGNWQEPLRENFPIAELRSLTHSFNQTADQLQQSFDRIKLALVNSEERFTTIFRASPDPIVLTTLDKGRILEVNDRYCEFYGYSREAVLGRTAIELGLWRNPDDRQTFVNHLRQNGQVRNLEVIVCPHEHQQKTVLLSAEVCDLKGEQCVITLLRDISDRKQVENQLRKNEADLQRAQQIAHCGNWDYDIATGRLYWSEEMYRIHGIEPGQPIAIGEEAACYFHPDDRDKFRQEIVQKANAGEPFESALRLLHPNGSIRHIDSRGEPIFDEHHRLVGLCGIVQDVTDRRLIENALRENEARLREAQRVAQVGSWEFDVATQRLYWSQELFRIVGFDPALPEPSFAELIAIVVEPDRAAWIAAVKRAIAAGIPYEVEHRIRRSDGSIRYLVSKGQGVFNNQQQVVKLYGTALDITDRKLAELALAESENHFQKLAAASPAVIYTVIEDVKGAIRFEYVSPAAEEIHEIPIADLRRDGAIVAQQMHPDDRAGYLQAVVHSLEAMQPFRYEWRIITPSGKVKWLQANSRPERRKTGETVWHGIVMDVTARKEAETALQESETRFRLAIENMPDVFVIYDRDRRFLYVNQRTVDRTGIPLAGYLGRRDEDIFPPEVCSYYLSLLVKTIETRTLQSGEININLPGQPPYDFFVKYVPVLDEQGEIQQIFGITIDITELNQTETALRRSEARFQHIAATVPGMLYEYAMYPDGSGHHLYVSPRSVDLLELDPPVLLQSLQSFWDMVLPEDFAAMQDASLEAAANRSLYFAEFRIITPSGKLKWIQVASLPSDQVEADGATIWSGLLLDVTDRKQMEQELRSAKEAAELANQAKSEFLANMSHELRTPLNSVLGFTQMMKRSAMLPSDSQEYVNLIYTSGSHLLNLINEILDLSKIEAGRLTLENKTVDLFELLQLVHITFNPKATKKGLQLHLKILPGVPQYISIDSQKLQQILINLIGNALKFTLDGSVHLVVSLTSFPACLQFQVIDSGVGIAPQDLELIFDAFAQAPAGRQSQEGTGLGLSISRRLVQLMGGEMTVSSTSGQGSTFQFTIPIQLATEELSSLQLDRSIVGLAPDQFVPRILIVDDQAENRLLLIKLLENLGITVQEATNGQEAIALWQEWQPHLIWLDLRMPGISGYEVAQRIRAVEQIRQTPTPTVIIALTAQASTDDRLSALAAGCNDYLSKPFQTDVLFNKIAEHLGIRYVYAGDSVATIDRTPLTAQQLAVMPHAWIVDLYNASFTCEQTAIRRLIQQIPSDHRNLAIALEQLTEDFDFGKMMQLTQEWVEKA